VIPVVYRANFGYLLRHPWQLALAVLGICVGVAVIVAVDLANASARKAFYLSMDAVTGEATHQVVGGPRGLDEGLYTRLRVEAGLQRIAPVVEGSVAINDTSLQLLGVDLFAEQALRSFTGQEGRDDAGDGEASQTLFRDMLTRPGAVMMSAATAAALGLEAGQAFELTAGGRQHAALLLGTFAGESGSALDNLVTADIATAQEWFGLEGRLSRIDARLDPADGAAVAGFEALLPPDAHLLTAAGRTRSTAEMSAAFMTNLTAMSLLALLVGLFLIYNSVSFSVLQRRPLIGILRALGVTRRQVFALVLVEAGGIGLVAALLGIAAGIWLGEGLLGLVSRSINDFYFRVTVTDVAVGGMSLSKGIVAGVGAALAAAAVPAIEAAACQPRLALVRSELERRTGRLLPAIALAGGATFAVALLVLLVSGRSLVAGLVAVLMLIVGFALCVPLAVRGSATVLAPAARTLAGVRGRLAVAGIGASLSRTGVAIVALAVAVSATVGVSVMVDSFRDSVADWLVQTLQADIYAGVQRGDMDPRLIEEISGLPGVMAVSTSRRVWLEDEGGRTQVLAIRMAPGSYAGTEILDADPTAVWPRYEAEDAVLVSEPYAYRNEIGRGDLIMLPTTSGARPFRVLATYQSYDINASAVLMSRSTYDRHFDDPGVDSIGLYLADGAAAGDVAAAVEALGAGRQRLIVNSNARIRELSLAIFDRTFVITDVLYWLALGVALIGILGAMLALQLERARELATLRALGMTPAQLGGMIVLQTAVIGLLAGIAALPLGVIMAWVLIEVINRRSFGWQIDMAVAPDILLAAVAFAIAAALAAGLYPAWRAAHSSPALAMREE
jgi:putative ABC transport system permease protein